MMELEFELGERTYRIRAIDPTAQASCGAAGSACSASVRRAGPAGRDRGPATRSPGLRGATGARAHRRAGSHTLGRPVTSVPSASATAEK